MLVEFPNFMTKTYSFTCTCCGKTYDEMPLCFGSEYPYSYYSIAEEERERRIELTESLCVIDEQHFFHRGRITIPIIDYPEDLVFTVWASISRENFELRNDLWNNPERVNQEPYFGWLQTVIPTYDNTLNIKTVAIENEIGLIPSIQVTEDLHPLTYDQQHGITYELALSKVQQILANEHK